MKRSISSGLETMLAGWLFSAIHLAMWALTYRVCVCAMRESDRALSLTGKGTENITTPGGNRLPIDSLIDDILAEAAYCVMSKVGS